MPAEVFSKMRPEVAVVVDQDGNRVADLGTILHGRETYRLETAQGFDKSTTYDKPVLDAALKKVSDELRLRLITPEEYESMQDSPLPPEQREKINLAIQQARL